jgi:hypothetical protein
MILCPLSPAYVAAATSTDRSLKLQGGTLAFTLVSLASGVQLTGAKYYIPGLQTNQCFYCSGHTSAGLLGMVILIDILCQFFQINSQQVTIVCNNLEVGQHGISVKFPQSLLDNHFDIISAILDIK